MRFADRKRGELRGCTKFSLSFLFELCYKRQVYRVISTDLKIYALKVINLQPDHFHEHVANYRMEINLLVKLRRRSRVVQLIDAEVFP